MDELQRMRNRQSTLRNWASFNNLPEVHLLRGKANPVHPAPNVGEQGREGQEVPGGATGSDQLGPRGTAGSAVGEINGLGLRACEG